MSDPDFPVASEPHFGADAPRVPAQGPVDADVFAYAAEIPTFLRLPLNRQGAGADICVLGIPFDGGITERAGAREGPRAVRLGSSISRYFHGTIGRPYDKCKIVDAGDVPINCLVPDGGRDQIAKRYRALRQAGARVVAVGGDHSATLHCLEALGWDEPVGLVHFDAHTDSYDSDSGSLINHATVFRRAIEAGYVDPKRSVQIGLRPDLHGREQLAWPLAAGMTIIDSDDIMVRGVESCADQMLTSLGAGPIYVSVDIDVLDPCFAPATGCPEPGGLSVRELRYLLARLKGLRLAGADLMEIAPPYDVRDQTALLAGRLLFDLVCLMAET
jgi:guanidinopropionase